MGRVSRKIEGLELGRFAFATTVVAYHYLYLGPVRGRTAGPELWHRLALGRFAVEAFFVISGYVIVRSAEGRTALDFLIARTRRLWPALALCATITLAVMALLTAGPPQWKGWLKAVTFVPMLSERGGWVDTSYWSIRIEMWFYLAVAALLLIFRRLPNLSLVSAVWLAASATAVFAPWLRAVTLTPYSAFFIFGLLLYAMERGDRRAAWLVAPALALGAWQAFDDFRTVDMLDGVRSPWWIGLAVAAVIFAATAAMRCGLPGRLGELAARRLGPMTYPLYLLHQWIGYALINALDDWIGYWPAVGAAVLFALGSAFAVSQYFEPRVGAWLGGVLTSVAARLAPPAGSGPADTRGAPP